MLAHGGRLIQAAQRYGIALDQWLDVSTGINPIGWPIPQIPEGAWRRLPEDEDGLLEVAQDYFAVRDLLPVAGTQAAIQALPSLRAPSRVGVLAPTYAEHGHAWQCAGHQVCAWNARMPIDDFDVLVIVNPNNPTGETFSAEQILDWQAQLSKRQGWLVIDEAYVDPTPAASVVSHGGSGGLIVLRSLGKFFGLPGARVGFVVGQAELLARLQALLGPWSVPGPSRWLASMAMADTAWQAAERTRLALQRDRLHGLLSRCGLSPAGGTALFQWVCRADAVDLHDCLARQGVLTRLFTAPASLRIGLPGVEPQWMKLECALKGCVS